ncbi:Protein of unknown function [Actinacidiphila yanglinensis]|uniref:DUF2637 domain-containing protein n=1 Tax=Actinacidiphila yanglinensis TaxID=310779 RepID=A0A1H6EC23_9ACTN|nr:DUF2637 domain-containing protein [Actinacidiphila yanglinensis]SEG94335.1 Protein of unknown function [Actinacidiphila yanglinensis]
MPPNTRTTAHQATTWDRAAVTLLGAAGCTLSYDALQQIALAVHVRPALTYLFPLVIDGFIAYGVRALLVLRNAPFRARLYIWTLFATATTASVWANALHAIRLNQQAPTAGLHLGDTTVGILSTIAPLALAGAVHLHILITRADATPPTTDTVTQPETTERQHETPVGPEQEIQHTRPELPPARHETSRPVRRIGRPPSAELDQLLVLARPAFHLHETPTRAVVREAIRAAGHTISEDRLTQLIAALRRERDGH